MGEVLGGALLTRRGEPPRERGHDGRVGLGVVKADVPGSDERPGVGPEQVLLLGGPLLGRGLERLAELRADLLARLGQLLLEHGDDEGVDLHLPFPLDRLDLDVRLLGPAAVLGRPERDQALRGRLPAGDVERRLEEGAEAVVVLVRDRVVAVGVALGAADGQAEQRRGDDLDRLGDGVVAGLDLVDAPLGRRVGGHPQESGRDQPIVVGGVEILRRADDHLVARELLADQDIPGAVGIERPDQVIAIFVGVRPDRVARGVAVAVGIAGHVEPVPRPAFAVVARVQQPIDEALVGIGGLVGHERLDLLGGRRQAEQVERTPGGSGSADRPRGRTSRPLASRAARRKASIGVRTESGCPTSGTSGRRMGWNDQNPLLLGEDRPRRR